MALDPVLPVPREQLGWRNVSTSDEDKRLDAIGWRIRADGFASG